MKAAHEAASAAPLAAHVSSPGDACGKLPKPAIRVTAYIQRRHQPRWRCTFAAPHALSAEPKPKAQLACAAALQPHVWRVSLPQPDLEPSVAAADAAGERLVSEVLSSVSKPPLIASGPGVGAYTVRECWACRVVGLLGLLATPALQACAWCLVAVMCWPICARRSPPRFATHVCAAGMSAATPAYASLGHRPAYASTPQPVPQQPAPPAPHSSASLYGAQPAFESPPRVDGKAFFQQARGLLSYEQFSQVRGLGLRWDRPRVAPRLRYRGMSVVRCRCRCLAGG